MSVSPSSVLEVAPESPTAHRSRPRVLAAIVFLLALCSLMLGSLLASGEETRGPRTYKHAAPANSGPIDPRC